MRTRVNSHKLQQEKVLFDIRKKNNLQVEVVGWSLEQVSREAVISPSLDKFKTQLDKKLHLTQKLVLLSVGG